MKSKSKMTKVFVGSLVPIALVLMLSLWPGGGAWAATFNIPDGDVAGLIAAINVANGNGEADTINLAPGGTYTLTAVNWTYFYTGPSGLPGDYQPNYHQRQRGDYPKKQCRRHTGLPDSLYRGR